MRNEHQPAPTSSHASFLIPHSTFIIHHLKGFAMSYNILTVDDSPTVRAVIGKTLRLAGIDLGDLHEAGNGEEALEILREQWIDLVFADINMPVMNGIELVERMSEHGIMQTIPVVIVSTEGSATRIDQLKRKGIVEYIRKPFTPESLKTVVDKILGEKNERKPD